MTWSIFCQNTDTHIATNPSWRLRLCFSKRTIFCLPLWLSLSHSLFISPSISISLSAQNAKLLHFSLSPLSSCSSTHLVINSKHIKPTAVPRYSPDHPTQHKHTHTQRQPTCIHLGQIANESSTMRKSDRI